MGYIRLRALMAKPKATAGGGNGPPQRERIARTGQHLQRQIRQSKRYPLRQKKAPAARHKPRAV